MRYFIDTEFIEDGRTIEPISIGIVREDGAHLYREFEAAVPLFEGCDPWIKENVLPHLIGLTDSKENIRDEILAFIGNDVNPEFWGYFADYDWVVMCQLFGRMVDLPKGWPKYCLDLKQWMVQLGVERVHFPDQAKESEHHALADARWNLVVWKFLDSKQTERDWSDK